MLVVVLWFNDAATQMGYFMFSAREKKKRHRKDSGTKNTERQERWGGTVT